MDNESFRETIRRLYSEEIREAYLEAEHTDGVDLSKLAQSLSKIQDQAKVEGIHEREFEDLVRTALPDVAAHMGYGKKAA